MNNAIKKKHIKGSSNTEKISDKKNLEGNMHAETQLKLYNPSKYCHTQNITEEFCNSAATTCK